MLTSGLRNVFEIGVMINGGHFVAALGLLDKSIANNIWR